MKKITVILIAVCALLSGCLKTPISHYEEDHDSAETNFHSLSADNENTAIDSKKVYSLSCDSRYLEISSDPRGTTLTEKGLANNIQISSSDTADNLSHQLWYFVQRSSTNEFAICCGHSLTQYICSPDGISVFSQNTIDGEKISATNLSGNNYYDYEFWKLYCDGSGSYKIVNVEYPDKYLCLNSDGNAILTSNSSSDGFIWSVSEMDYQIGPDDKSRYYWNGKCCSELFPDEVVIAVDMSGTYRDYMIDVQPLDTSFVTFNQIKNAVESWNDISGNVSVICKKVEELNEDDIVLSVIADGESNGQTSPFLQWTEDGTTATLGIMIPVINGIEAPENGICDNLNCNWDSSVVYVSTKMYQILGIGYGELLNALKHEIGHALKLRHTSTVGEDETLNPGTTYPSVMQPFSDVRSVSYIESLLHCSTEDYTYFDYSILRKKWRS